MKISDELIADFFTCKYKAYLKSNEHPFQITPFEEYLNCSRERLEASYLEKSKTISCTHFNHMDLDTESLFSVELNGWYNLKLVFEVRKGFVIPIHFSALVNDKDVIRILIFKSYLLKSIVKTDIIKGRIVSDDGVKNMKVNLDNPSSKQVIDLIINIDKNKPKFSLNKNCSWCGFQFLCKKEAKEKDHLSLLSTINIENIQDYHNKGIFTIHQLSYQFKPRKTRADAKSVNTRHIPALKALALRKQTIFIYKKDINLNMKRTPKVFFDIEGYLGDNQKIYLIGVVIERETYFIKKSFWVPNVYRKIRVVYNEFIDCLMYYCPNGATLYHYGSYDLKFLRNLRQGIKKVERRIYVDNLIENGVNILEIFLHKIYLPTYSNDLKTISKYLGFKWEGAIHSGLEAYVYRKKWEGSRSKKLKEALIKYNRQDCISLKTLVDFLDKIQKESSENDKYKITSDFTEETQRRYSGRKFGNVNEVMDGFKFINERAYFNYQRDKVYFRESKLKKSQKLKKTKHKVKPDTCITIEKLSECPYCKSNKVQVHKNAFHKKLVIDLKIQKTGLRRFLIYYKSHAIICLKCMRSFRSEEYKLLRKYGHNLMSWVVYQYVANIVSFEKINRMAEDFFGLKQGNQIGFDSCYSFKEIMASYYTQAYEEIINRIKDWKILHIDETKAKLRGGYGYVWVFTNMDSVIFMYRNDRKTEFLRDILVDFKGVLISDFYKGFDSLSCIQQKCLIHLLRDINDMLFKEQLNAELISISNQFSTLMKKIITTIDHYGLRKRNLNKHNKEVDRFFAILLDLKTTTESGIKLRKRLLSNKDRLFTFLNFDDVPWNNNNAEHSIKHFANYRKEVKGLINENGLNSYLVLLSLYKTCEYSKLNFLKFLLSKERSISSYKKHYTKFGNRRKGSKLTIHHEL